MQVGLTTAAAGLHDAQLIATLARKQDEVDSMTTALATLYVHGHDLDFRTLFPNPADRPIDPATDYADVPPTKFRRKPYWLDVRFTGDASALMPGNHVATPDGRHIWEFAPKAAVTATDLSSLVKAAAAQVLPDAALTAFEQRAIPGEGSRLVTTLTRHPGGATVQVHARIEESFTLVFDAVVTRAGQASALPPRPPRVLPSHCLRPAPTWRRSRRSNPRSSRTPRSCPTTSRRAPTSVPDSPSGRRTPGDRG